PHRLSTRLSSRELPTELTPLIEAFNHALDRLEKGYRVQQEFLAGAAHELKTPLALIRGQIEMDGVADRATLLKDVDLMARQVHQLLHLAEVSEAQNYVIEPTDLAGVGSDAADYLARLAERRQIALNVLSPPLGAMLDADRSAAFVLMKNLLENAIQHSPAGGVVTLHIDDQGLRVRDEGAGIAAEDFSQLFVRFWRGAGRRDEGAGLGLAICQQIAMAHGWHLSARNAGPGAEFNLVFKPA
ncbi:MAG: histidine kinase, partial [Rhizobacter sp.]|nr:histidine kinase [Rhizobacter sp.]